MTRLTDAGSGLSLRVVRIDFGMRVLNGSYATEANMDQFVDPKTLSVPSSSKAC